jgi:hypothetical protein
VINEIVVDAHDAEERAIGWEAYLDDVLTFPFEALCVKEVIISPLKKDEKIAALKMAPFDCCRNGMFVIVEWQNRQFGVPLEQILPVDSDEETVEAIKDWHYWVEHGYQF